MGKILIQLVSSALKFEILNPKYETISKLKCSKFETAKSLTCFCQRVLGSEHWDFGHSDLFRISIFEFRIFLLG
jgi:hypothetical protein